VKFGTELDCNTVRN